MSYNWCWQCGQTTQQANQDKSAHTRFDIGLVLLFEADEQADPQAGGKDLQHGEVLL